MDALKVLGLKKGNTLKDAKKNFRVLSLKYHPDKNSEDSAVDSFNKVAEAYEYVLTNPSCLKEDIIKEKFSKRGEDTHLNLRITYEEVFFERVKTVLISRKKECSDCLGTGSKSKVPTCCGLCDGRGTLKGKSIFIQDGNRTCPQCSGSGTEIPESDTCRTCMGRSYNKSTAPVEVPISLRNVKKRFLVMGGSGNAGSYGGGPGDLYIKFAVDSDDRYKFVSGVLVVDGYVSPAANVVGGKCHVSLFGEEYQIPVEPFSENAKMFIAGRLVIVSISIDWKKVPSSSKDLYRKIVDLESNDP